MGRIEFHSLAGDFQMHPIARESARQQMAELFLAQAATSENWGELEEILRPTWRLLSFGGRGVDQVAIQVHSVLGLSFAVRDTNVPIWTVVLNTAKYSDDPAIQLIAKLEGQCEGNCYVEGRNRSWLAEIIEQGVSRSVLNEDDGWADLAAYLRDDAHHPVVASYSCACTEFMSPESYMELGLWVPASLVDVSEDDREVLTLSQEAEVSNDWGRLPAAERWDIAMQHLRRQQGLEIAPDTLPNLFGNGTDLQAVLSSL
jgi:hypothetical protein